MGMITITTFDNKEFKIANSYEELSFGQYVDIIKVGDGQLSGTKADIEIISILSDKPEEIKEFIWDMPQDDYNELVTHFEWIHDSNMTERLKKSKPKEIFYVDGEPYSVISNFGKQMSLNDQMAFEEIMKKGLSDLHNLEIAFGVLIRPLVDNKLAKFDNDVFDTIIKNKYKINMIDVYSAISFFLLGDKQSSVNTTKRFSVRQN